MMRDVARSASLQEGCFPVKGGNARKRQKTTSIIQQKGVPGNCLEEWFWLALGDAGIAEL